MGLIVGGIFMTSFGASFSAALDRVDISLLAVSPGIFVALTGFVGVFNCHNPCLILVYIFLSFILGIGLMAGGALTFVFDAEIATVVDEFDNTTIFAIIESTGFDTWTGNYVSEVKEFVKENLSAIAA